MADGIAAVSSRRVIAYVEHAVKGLVQAKHHIIRMAALSADQCHALRHGGKVDVSGVSVSVLDHYLAGSCLQSRLADNSYLLCHPFCKLAVLRRLLMCFAGKRRADAAFNISADKQLHNAHLLFSCPLTRYLTLGFSLSYRWQYTK